MITRKKFVYEVRSNRTGVLLKATSSKAAALKIKATIAKKGFFGSKALDTHVVAVPRSVWMTARLNRLNFR